MSLLTMVQKVCRRVGIAVPNLVVDNTDVQIIQLLALADEEGEDLEARCHWRAQVRDTTFTIVGTANQGAIDGTVVSDGDFDHFINDSIWNRTTSLPITGPLNDMEWQTLQASPVTGPYQQWQEREGNFYIDPTPTAGETMGFSYVSTSWCQSSGGVGRAAWAADNDTGLLDESLMGLGLRWRWLKTKGLEYAEDFATYERRVMDAMARDGSKPMLSLESRDRDYRQAGVIIPIGSWDL